jgi:hypothetical protein
MYNITSLCFKNLNLIRIIPCLFLAVHEFYVSIKRVKYKVKTEAISLLKKQAKNRNIQNLIFGQWEFYHLQTANMEEQIPHPVEMQTTISICQACSPTGNVVYECMADLLIRRCLSVRTVLLMAAESSCRLSFAHHMCCPQMRHPSQRTE